MGALVLTGILPAWEALSDCKYISYEKNITSSTFTEIICVSLERGLKNIYIYCEFDNISDEIKEMRRKIMLKDSIIVIFMDKSKLPKDLIQLSVFSYSDR